MLVEQHFGDIIVTNEVGGAGGDGFGSLDEM